VQLPEGGHVSSQLPDEQSTVHGDVVHDPTQLPEEQLHVPAGHETLWRGTPVPGSDTAGPPLGDGPAVPLEPLHAGMARSKTVEHAERWGIGLVAHFRPWPQPQPRSWS
jgi:hypothetical protein